MTAPYIQNHPMDADMKAMLELIRTDIANAVGATTKQVTGTTSVTNVATAVESKFSLMNTATLKNARAIVITAGTSAGLAGVGGAGGYSIVTGTTTAGVILTGSDTAGSSLGPFSLGNTVVPAGQLISLLHGTETTGVFGVTIEYTDNPFVN